jgi:hypothetical protein
MMHAWSHRSGSCWGVTSLCRRNKSRGIGGVITECFVLVVFFESHDFGSRWGVPSLCRRNKSRGIGVVVTDELSHVLRLMETGPQVMMNHLGGAGSQAWEDEKAQ